MFTAIGMMLTVFVYWRVNKTDRARRIRKKTEKELQKDVAERNRKSTW